MHSPGTIEIKVTRIDRLHKHVEIEICNPDRLDDPIKATLKVEDWISVGT